MKKFMIIRKITPELSLYPVKASSRISYFSLYILVKTHVSDYKHFIHLSIC